METKLHAASFLRSPLCWAGPLLWILGLSVIALRPPCSGASEGQHLIRAYALSRGDLTGTQQYGVPGTITSTTVADDILMLHSTMSGHLVPPPGDWLNAFHASHHWTQRRLRDRAFVPCQFAASAPALYLSQTLAALLGRALGTRTMVVLYLARLLNLAAVYLMIRTAIAWVAPSPRLRAILGIIAIAATVPLLSAGTAAVLAALSILAFAAAIRLAYRPSVPTAVWFLLTAAILATSGSLYLVLPALAGLAVGLQRERPA
jgi:Predicted membrane protein (DUF2142)